VDIEDGAQDSENGGICAVSFPNIDSLQARVFRGNWLHLDPPRHLSYWRPSDFVRQMAGLGLTLEKKSFANLEQNPFRMIQSILNCATKRRDILYESLRGNRDYLAGVSRLMVLAQRLFLVATFPVFVLSDLIVSALGKGATVQLILRKT